MQFYYGDKNLLRVLDEADFWKRQESEHPVVIREIVSNLERVYVKRLQEWEQAFCQTHGMVVRYIETVIRAGCVINPTLKQQILQLICFCIEQSKQFIQFLNTLATESEAVRNNPVALTVIGHIRRESQYFIGIAQTVLYAKKCDYPLSETEPE